VIDMVGAMLGGWWEAERPIPRMSVLVNLAIAAVCGVAAWFEWEVGLGEMTRIFLGYYAVLLGAYAVFGWQLGDDGRRARPVRLAADIGNWMGLAGFAVLGLAAYDPVETGPLYTFIVFAVVVVAISVAKYFRVSRQPSTESS
jgi:hypothetical protein